MDTAIFFDTLDRIFAEKRPQDAEKYMTDALAEAEFSEDLPAIVTVCNELGGYYRYTSRYEKALPLYQKALSGILALGQRGTAAHGTTLINWATTCAACGRSEEALSLYGQAAEIFTDPGYEKDFNLAALYNNMSFVCQDLGRFSEAEELLQKALEILRSLPDSLIEIAGTYNNLAGIYVASGRTEEARSLLEQAVNIYLDETGGRDVHYAAAVNTLGEVCFLSGDYAEALDRFTEALKLNIRDYGENTDSSRIIEANLKLCREKIAEKELQQNEGPGTLRKLL